MCVHAIKMVGNEVQSAKKSIIFNYQVSYGFIWKAVLICVLTNELHEFQIFFCVLCFWSAGGNSRSRETKRSTCLRTVTKIKIV